MTKGWIALLIFVSSSVLGQSVLLPQDKLTMRCYRPLWQELKQRVSTLKGYFFPVSRVNNLFAKSDFDCVFPFAGQAGLDAFSIDSKTVILSKPVNHLGLYLLSNEQPSRSLTVIRNDPSIEIASELGLETIFNDWKGHFYRVGEMKQVFEMLHLNRVNYIVVTFPDAYSEFQNSKLNIAAVITLTTENFMCKKTDIGMRTVGKINEIIEDMKRDGTMKEKLGDCFFSPEMAPMP